MRAHIASTRGLLVMSVVVGLLVAPACSTNPSGLGGDAGPPAPGTGGAAGSVAAGGKSGGSGGGGGATGGNVGGNVGTGGMLGSGGAAGAAPGGKGGASGPGGAGGTTSGGKGGNLSTGGAGGGMTGGKGGSTSSGGAGGASTGGKGGGVGSGGKGGAVGSGGKGGSGGAGGTNAGAPECATASDCKLYDGCCVCQAQPVNATPPADCAIACLQSQCQAEQLPQNAVACVAGRCVAGFNCDASKVTCKIAVTACDPGYVPAINAAGTCYQGGCVPATQCARVTGCSSCGPSEACVIYQTQLGPETHCVTVPSSCKSNGTCECLGPSACTGAFKSCGNLSGQRGITCTCPNC